MSRLLLVCLTFALYDISFGQAFSGQVFVMTEHFSADNCLPKIECDCCSSDILFLTEEKFIMVDKCVQNDIYFRGTYKAAKRHLTLNFDQFSIHEVYNEGTGKASFKRKDSRIPPIQFNIASCNQNVTLQRTDMKVLTKAFKESDKRAAERLKNLKQTDAWKYLY